MQGFWHPYNRGLNHHRMRDPKGAPHRFSGGAARPFIQRDAARLSAHGAQIDPFVHCGLHHRCLQYPDITVIVSKNASRLYFEPRSFQALWPAARSCGGSAARSLSGLQGHETPHRRTPSPPTALALCRRLMWLSRGGYVARGFAKTGDSAVAPWLSIDTPTMRPGMARL